MSTKISNFCPFPKLLTSFPKTSVDEPVVIPINKKVRFLITANDVIHAWWVPALAVKRDAIPGYINDVWTIVDEPGIYRGQCAELCGKAHGFMPIVVHAMDEVDYQQWLDAKKVEAEELKLAMSQSFSMDELYARGEKVYQSNCVACHGPDGKGNKALNSPSLVGLQDWYIVRQLKNFKDGIRGSHKDDIYGQSMRPMSMTLINDKAMKDVTAYILSLRDN